MLPEDNVRISRGARRAAIMMLLLTIFIGGANLLSSYFEYHHFATSQQQATQTADAKLCATLDKLAALKAPSGSPVGNPSRAYEQQLAMTLAQLKPDIGCSP
jgi:hypothetical protein